MTGLRSRIAAVAVCLMLVSAAAGAARADAKPSAQTLAPTDIAIDARPITAFCPARPDEKHFGQLEFLGGLVLTSPDSRNFGGWSGLVMDADAKGFAAVSDSGVWLIATLEYEGEAPSAIKNARLGPILARDGQALKGNRDRDAEAIALMSGTVRDGSALIAFEQNSRLMRYDIANGHFTAARETLGNPRASANMRRNNGFEAMTVMRGGPHKGQVVALSERLYNSLRNHTGWIWTERKAESFYITNIGDFDITDITSLDDGSLFVLERRFRWIEGVKMRIRRIAASDLQPGKTVTGETLLEADSDFEIDNMEALAATRDADGRVVLTIMSDDNFNRSLQRTLLLQFAVGGATAAKTRP